MTPERIAELREMGPWTRDFEDPCDEMLGEIERLREEVRVMHRVDFAVSMHRGTAPEGAEFHQVGDGFYFQDASTTCSCIYEEGVVGWATDLIGEAGLAAHAAHVQAVLDGAS